MNKKIIIGLIIVILACCGVYAGLNMNTNSNTQDIDYSNLEVEDTLTVNDEQNIEKKFISTDNSDTNTILVENNSTLELENSAVNKTGDSSSNGDDTDFYGTNSAVLVKKGSSAILDNIDINTNATGANAIFVTNAESDGSNSNSGDSNMMSGTPPEMSGDNSQEKPGDIPNNGNEKPGDTPENSAEKPESMPDSNNTQMPEMPSNEGNDGQNDMNMGQSDEDYSDGGANANVSNVVINTYKDKSRGIDATYGGVVNAENVIINTRGSSCASLATDRGEGTIVAENCELNTGVDNGTGRGSPCIYSTGNISVENCKGTAYVSQIACIEGKNSITMNSCDFTGFAGGNREDNGKFVDLGGIFIYQSMSGDADVGTATLNATDSKLSIDENSEYYESAPMFHVTNTKAIVNLDNCECNFGSGTLLEVSGQNQWGNTGSNGGDLEFNIQKESLTGNIIIDEISSLVFNMENSEFTGAINPDDSYGNTSVSISEGSTWTLTGDSHISSLENNGQIEYGSYTLYVDGEAFNSENPYTS